MRRYGATAAHTGALLPATFDRTPEFGLIQERGGDSLSPVVFRLDSFEAGTGRPRPFLCAFLNQPWMRPASGGKSLDDIFSERMS